MMSSGNGSPPNKPPKCGYSDDERIGDSLTDKGPGKGALGVVLREIFDSAGNLLAESRNVSVLRGDGGFSSVSGVSDAPPQPLPRMPEGTPDIKWTAASLPQAALMYRLSCDYNPLHADPTVAAAAGFPRPILCGLATYGMAADGVQRGVLDYDASRLKGLAVRFTAPVFPGDAVTVQLWRETPERWRLRARVAAREKVVLDQGVVDVAA